MQPNDQGGQYYGAPPPQYNNPTPVSHNSKRGSNKTWIIVCVILAVLVLALGSFAAWAYSERTKYKNNTMSIAEGIADVKVKEAVTEKENEFIEREKEPLETYQGPSQFGGIKLLYPKTWSAYINEGTGDTPIDGYLHPGFVPGIDSGTAFALRVQVLNGSYDQELEGYESLVKNNKVTVTPFRMEKVPNVLGSRVVGEINRGQQGHVVLLPLRDKTLKISTEANTFLKDFNEIILRNFEFTP